MLKQLRVLIPLLLYLVLGQFDFLMNINNFRILSSSLLELKFTMLIRTVITVFMSTGTVKMWSEGFCFLYGNRQASRNVLCFYNTEHVI